MTLNGKTYEERPIKETYKRDLKEKPIKETNSVS